jgi:hypothetical protein
MKANKLAALIVTTYIGFIATAHASAPQPIFSPEQEARIGKSQQTTWYPTRRYW